MSDESHWLGLLGPVPPKDGECRRRVMHDAPFEDWVEVRLVLGGGAAGQRIVTAMFDADDQPGSVSDLVTAGGKRETVAARVGTGGRLQGAYRVGDDDKNVPRPLTEPEEQALRAIAVSLRQRYP